MTFIKSVLSFAVLTAYTTLLQAQSIPPARTLYGTTAGAVPPGILFRTAPNSYNITVTGTSGSLQHSIPLTLTIQ
jgi:hypothetical protein